MVFKKHGGLYEFGGLTGYSLILVHYIGTGNLWQIKRFGGHSGGGLTRIQCMNVHTLKSFQIETKFIHKNYNDNRYRELYSEQVCL